MKTTVTLTDENVAGLAWAPQTSPVN